ncbi:hypothetical protein [Flavobacterium hydrocarbonoxydans]|nr:hypothetical protein [Flavobacterium hydrocarbonoxydans]
MSSINISSSFERLINDNTEVNSVKGITCNFLKKIFKCDGIVEELDDYETKDSKTNKLSKGIPSLDYLIPVDNSISSLDFKTASNKKNYTRNPVFLFGFYGKIHLRPPQNIA